MGEVKEVVTVETVNNLGEELSSSHNQVQEVIDRVMKPIKELVDRWSDARHFYILGSGPSYATAVFTAAKLVEAAGVVAVSVDIEEWAHFYNFSSDTTIPILMFAPTGNGDGRVEEIVSLLRRRGHRLMVITTGDSPFEQADDILVACDHVDELHLH